MSLGGRLGELQAKVDAFFDRAAARHADDMQCHTGCSDCCHVRLTVTTVEAVAIWEHLQALPAEERDVIADAAGQTEHGGRCAALRPDGRCRIYAVRPIVCRSHGAPIRMRANSLPVLDERAEIQSCFRNFTHTEPDPDCVLDQETLSAMTLAVDREVGSDGERVDLAALLVGEIAFDVDDDAGPADE